MKSSCVLVSPASMGGRTHGGGTANRLRRRNGEQAEGQAACAEHIAGQHGRAAGRLSRCLSRGRRRPADQDREQRRTYGGISPPVLECRQQIPDEQPAGRRHRHRIKRRQETDAFPARLPDPIHAGGSQSRGRLRSRTDDDEQKARLFPQQRRFAEQHAEFPDDNGDHRCAGRQVAPGTGPACARPRRPQPQRPVSGERRDQRGQQHAVQRKTADFNDFRQRRSPSPDFKT